MLTRLSQQSKLQASASLRLHRRCELIINVNGHPSSGDDVALFIDWENFKISLAAGNRLPNVSALKEEVANHGRVVVAKAYADWVTRSPELKGASQFIIDPPALYAAGIEPVYVPTRLPLGTPSAINTRTTRVKNSVDVKMTADCIECAHSYPNIGTYVLVSGDSDFIHVINSLRAIGKRVIIIGVSWSTSRRLADQVDGLILYDIDVDPEVAPEPAPAPSTRPSRSNGANRQQLSDVMRVIEEIVRSERQAGRTPLLTSLKQRIMRRVPGFDEKKLGFSGFKKLMLRTAEEGNIQLVTVGLVDWVIMADEPIPEEALPEARVSDGAIESVAAGEEVIPEGEAETESRPESMASADTVTETDIGAVAEAATEEGQEQTELERDSVETDAGEAAQAVSEAGPADDGATVEIDSTLGQPTAETEAPSDANESMETGKKAPPALSPELERAVEETLANLELPKGPGDGQDGRRISDLIIMADMLEHQAEVSHVAFNFLLEEICGALEQGLEAEHPEIAGRWGGRIYSRTYVTRLLRELGEKEVFVRDWHLERNGETGRTRRFRTFNLNRSHSLVKEAVVNQWGPETDSMPVEVETRGNEVEAVNEVAVEEDVAKEDIVRDSAVPAMAEETGPVESISTATFESAATVNGETAVEGQSEETPDTAERPRRNTRRGGGRRRPETHVTAENAETPVEDPASNATVSEEAVAEATPTMRGRRGNGRRKRETPTSAEPATATAEDSAGEAEVPEAPAAKAPTRRGRGGNGRRRRETPADPAPVAGD